MQYYDKHGNEIKAGMSLRHDDGEVKLVYEGEDDLGFNASNEEWKGFSEHARELYPLYQFNLNEWEIVVGGRGDKYGR